MLISSQFCFLVMACHLDCVVEKLHGSSTSDSVTDLSVYLLTGQVSLLHPSSVVRYPRYLDTYRRYLSDDASIANVTIYRSSKNAASIASIDATVQLIVALGNERSVRCTHSQSVHYTIKHNSPSCSKDTVSIYTFLHSWNSGVNVLYSL